jgi:4-hydroxy-4-methyl-2-oxoglutarate aldolase
MNNVAPLREQIVAKLYSAVLSDVLDAAGHPHQAMRPFLRPLDDSLVLFGRVRRGLYANSYHVDLSKNPYAVEIALVDDLQTGDVPVLACGGPTDRIAPWGELLTTASARRGASGCVTDGLVRDVRRIRAMAFPVFHGGIGPLDSKGRGEMIARDVPVECAGARGDGRLDFWRRRWRGRRTASRRQRDFRGGASQGSVRGPDQTGASGGPEPRRSL